MFELSAATNILSSRRLLNFGFPTEEIITMLSILEANICSKRSPLPEVPLSLIALREK